MREHRWHGEGFQAVVTDLEDGASGMWYCDVAGGEFQPEYPEGQRMVAEILRLAARDYQHQIFVAELISRLGLTREAMELSDSPIGNQILEIVGTLAARVRELEGAVAMRDGESDPWAATVTAEEGQEIIAELTAALAVLFGEDLAPHELDAIHRKVATRRRQQDEAAATLREALDEQGRLRLENQRLRLCAPTISLDGARLLADLRNAVTVACVCGGHGPNDPKACPACRVWHLTQ
jgi:uncharacterized protein with von Willebrand factor type A (vWA) domain